MPGEISPPLRLLQAACFPGHGVLLRNESVVLESGEARVIQQLAGWASRVTNVHAEALDDEWIALGRRAGEWTIAVAVPRGVAQSAMHEKLARALSLYVRAASTDPGAPPMGGGSSGGASGAPALVFALTVRVRPS